MNRILIKVVLAMVPALSSASEHPEVWMPDDWGFRWVAASWVFEDDGSVASRVSKSLGEKLERRSRAFDEQFRSAQDHGLVEGQVLPPREFCVSQELVHRVVPEDGWLFDPAVLLSDVAVAATVKEVVLGFGPDASPAALLALDDIVPIHGHSLQPRYLLINVERAVIRDRVFCGDMSIEGKYEPKVGTRIVVLGSLGDAGVVELVPRRAGSLAQVEPDGVVTWKWSRDTGPSTLDGVLTRASELIADGLFDAAVALRATHEGEEAKTTRANFGRSFFSLWHQQGCRDVEIVTLSSGPDVACKAKVEP